MVQRTKTFQKSPADTPTRKSSHSHLDRRVKSDQWYLYKTITASWYNLLSLKDDPHLSSPRGAQFSQTPAILELSFSILTNEPHEAGVTSVWPLKYCTTASPELLAAVVTWNVRPCLLLQWNLSWVKDKCLLSSFRALLLRNISSLFIPRYDVLIGSWEGGIELSITKLEIRSQPPEITRGLEVAKWKITQLISCDEIEIWNVCLLSCYSNA